MGLVSVRVGQARNGIGTFEIAYGQTSYRIGKCDIMSGDLRDW